MRSTKRLKKLATKRQQRAQKAGAPAIRITWVTPGDEAEALLSPAGEPDSMTINLTRGPALSPGAPAWLDDAAEPAPAPPPQPRGQRPLPPTEEARQAALAQLRERAQRGQYIGELPPSADEPAADHQRREAERRDAELIRRTSAPASSAPRRQPVNKLAAWVQGR